MVKNTKNQEGDGWGNFGFGEAASALDRIFGGWIHLVWKFAVFYALWIGLSYIAMTNAAGTATVQLAAIAYWFGWLFLVMTGVVVAFIAVTSWLDRRRIMPNRSET